jgi:hypothetical protein
LRGPIRKSGSWHSAAIVQQQLGIPSPVTRIPRIWLEIYARSDEGSNVN